MPILANPDTSLRHAVFYHLFSLLGDQKNKLKEWLPKTSFHLFLQKPY